MSWIGLICRSPSGNLELLLGSEENIPWKIDSPNQKADFSSGKQTITWDKPRKMLIFQNNLLNYHKDPWGNISNHVHFQAFIRRTHTSLALRGFQVCNLLNQLDSFIGNRKGPLSEANGEFLSNRCHKHHPNTIKQHINLSMVWWSFYEAQETSGVRLLQKMSVFNQLLLSHNCQKKNHPAGDC